MMSANQAEPLRGHYDSYEPRATRPADGSTWIWEPDESHARAQITVEEVRWNGEEWWIKASGYWNDLSRFWEACVPDPDPNYAAIGETIRWLGGPHWAKDTPRWQNIEAYKMRWTRIAPWDTHLWKRVA